MKNNTLKSKFFIDYDISKYTQRPFFGLLGKIFNLSDSIYNQNNFNLNDKDKKKLNFDVYEQKMRFTKSMTKGCGSYCYLIFYVKPNMNNIIENNTEIENQNYELFSEFNLFFRIFDDNDFIDITNDKYIVSSLSTNNTIDGFNDSIEKNDKGLISAFEVYAVTKDKKRASSSLRISLSYLTTKEEIDTFIDSFRKNLKQLDFGGKR